MKTISPTIPLLAFAALLLGLAGPAQAAPSAPEVPEASTVFPDLAGGPWLDLGQPGSIAGRGCGGSRGGTGRTGGSRGPSGRRPAGDRPNGGDGGAGQGSGASSGTRPGEEDCDRACRRERADLAKLEVNVAKVRGLLAKQGVARALAAYRALEKWATGKGGGLLAKTASVKAELMDAAEKELDSVGRTLDAHDVKAAKRVLVRLARELRGTKLEKRANELLDRARAVLPT